jgi:hypothetical protein
MKKRDKQPHFFNAGKPQDKVGVTGPIFFEVVLVNDVAARDQFSRDGGSVSPHSVFKSKGPDGEHICSIFLVKDVCSGPWAPLRRDA